MRSPTSVVLAVLLSGVLVAGCSGRGEDEDVTHVIASTTILGDVAANVAGNLAEVEVLIPIGVDPHAFQASASQAAAMREADLVIVTGLDLEEGLGEVLDSARADGTVILELGPAVDPIPMRGGSPDPHFWLDPVRMAGAVTLIGEALADIKPGSADVLRTRAADYRDAVLEGHQTVGATLAAIPTDRRLLVTDHESLGYFADRYGFTIVGVVIPGGTTLAEPSAGDLADLITVVSGSEVGAIFTDTTRPADLADAIATESGDDVAVVPLYTGSLGGEGSGAETYLSMMLLDAERIAAALVE